jgi:hypothetical protein
MVTRKAKNRTRKASRRQTVEGLHASFTNLDTKVRAAIKKGCTDAQLACCIRYVWSSLFHTDLSTPAVRGMVLHYRAVHSKKTRKQRGGMAPVAWTMGQGVTDQVYGRFPAEIGTTPQTIRALDLGRFFESNGGRTCNTTGGHAAQMGGVHYPATVPRNSLEIIGSTLQGAPITNPIATPVSSTANTSTFHPLPYDAKSLMMINTMAPIKA